ncbi:MAG: hypothetical protein PHN38_01030 [Sulfurospirillaceae bacterium]|nr:hypothetical protein [Sulfurospirillaceae bacterium]
MKHNDDTLDMLEAVNKLNKKFEEPKEKIVEKIIYRDMGKINIKPKRENKQKTEEDNKLSIPNFVWYAITALCIVYITREIFFINQLEKVNEATTEMLKMNTMMIKGGKEMLDNLQKNTKETQNKFYEKRNK